MEQTTLFYDISGKKSANNMIKLFNTHNTPFKPFTSPNLI